MIRQALVVGYGSIGTRHAQVLRDMGLDVTVVSRRRIEGFPCTANLAEAAAAMPDAYIVIATETSAHRSALEILSTSPHHGPVLVEKPLFATPPMDGIGPFSDRIWVGYNLRFHPLLQSLKARLAGKTIYSIEAAVGQYLPNWRPDSDYRAGYSARKGDGGVLRDLSHEIDYLLWLFGPWKRVAALVGTSGALEIDSEDYASLLVEGAQFRAAALGLDYLDQPVRRFVSVQHDGGTTRLDFVAGRLIENGETVEEASLDRNHTYRAQHEAMLTNHGAGVCTYEEAIAAVRAIDATERAAETGEWVTL